MKKISRVLIFIFTLECFSTSLLAKDISLNFRKLDDLELALASSEVQKNSPPLAEKKNEDEQFAERSQKVEKFTFTQLPKHLGYDIKESFWGWGALGFAVGAGISGGLYQKDKSIEYGFRPHALFGSTGDKVISDLGSPYAMAGAGILTTIVGVGAHNEKLKTTGEAMMESLFWSELLAIGAKYAFHRRRPDGGKNGFPSAHATGVFSTATVLQMMYGWKAGVPAYAFASLVSLARIDSYKHFPSDVLMGATLGAVIAYGTSRFHKNLHNNFSLMPDMGKDRYGMLLYHEF